MKVCLGVNENNGDHILSDAGSIGDPNKKMKVCLGVNDHILSDAGSIGDPCRKKNEP